MTQIVNLAHTSGNTFTATVTITDTDSVPINLTGGTIVMTVKRDPEDTDYVAQSSATLANQGTSPGVASFEIDDSNFNVENGTYWYDMVWTDSSGVVNTFMKGNFEISYRVT